jgi:hypothetical protein
MKSELDYKVTYTVYSEFWYEPEHLKIVFFRPTSFFTAYSKPL